MRVSYLYTRALKKKNRTRSSDERTLTLRHGRVTFIALLCMLDLYIASRAIYIYIYVCMYVCMYVCVCVCVGVGVGVGVCVCV